LSLLQYSLQVALSVTVAVPRFQVALPLPLGPIAVAFALLAIAVALSFSLALPGLERIAEPLAHAVAVIRIIANSLSLHIGLKCLCFGTKIDCRK
jgi:hypothetical protein